MCSRYCLTSPPEVVRAYFQLAEIDPFPPRYNIAPTQPVGIVRNSVRGAPEFVLVRWGLIPSWVKNPMERSTLFNARAETAAEKPSFRGSMRHRRCLIPSDGFYEWTGKAGAKIPHLIRPPAGGLMALAGLWEHWVGADGSELETMAILTVAANTTLAPLHDRMPVILAPETHAAWLDCRSGSSLDILDLMRPAANDLLDIIPVNPLLNDVRREGPDLQVSPKSTLF
ncbi:MAG: SOS response-associated peptidase [Hyphomicrobiaceae bacterium]